MLNQHLNVGNRTLIKQPMLVLSFILLWIKSITNETLQVGTWQVPS